nr:glycosyltransferase [Caldimonas sp.]
DQETFGLSALEAMACATPAVLRASAGLAELCDDGGGAIGVGEGSANAFAEAIAALFACDRGRRARAARTRAEASDWQRVLPSLLAHYQRLVGARGGAAASDAAATTAMQR